MQTGLMRPGTSGTAAASPRQGRSSLSRGQLPPSCGRQAAASLRRPLCCSGALCVKVFCLSLQSPRQTGRTVERQLPYLLTSCAGNYGHQRTRTGCQLLTLPPLFAELYHFASLESFGNRLPYLRPKSTSFAAARLGIFCKKLSPPTCARKGRAQSSPGVL